MDNQQGKSLDVAWLAGFLDGEGSFMMLHHTRGKQGYPYSKQWKPAIKVASTDEPTLQEVADILDSLGLPYHVSRRRPKNPQWSSSWMIEVFGLKRCLRWCNALLSSLRTKREEASLMKEYCELRLAQKPSWNIPQGRKGAKPQQTDRQLEIISRLRGRHGGVHLKNPSETTRPTALTTG